MCLASPTLLTHPSPRGFLPLAISCCEGPRVADHSLLDSWQSSSNAGDELASGAQPLSSWPSPYHSNSNQISPRRREHAVQPPPLTTALNNSQFQGLGLGLGAAYSPAPLSTTSLSSPFTHGQSPVVASPGGLALGSSPMSSRQYNVPYNPQDWGPVGHSSVNPGQQSYPQANNMLRIVPQPRSSGPHSGLIPVLYSMPLSIIVAIDNVGSSSPELKKA